MLIITTEITTQGVLVDTINARTSDRMYSIATDSKQLQQFIFQKGLVDNIGHIAVGMVFQQWDPCHPYVH
jgi:hypothetical protein